jgi:hypothetical protein
LKTLIHPLDYGLGSQETTQEMKMDHFQETLRGAFPGGRVDTPPTRLGGMGLDSGGRAMARTKEHCCLRQEGNEG